jgi:hypothetical protein
MALVFPSAQLGSHNGGATLVLVQPEHEFHHKLKAPPQGLGWAAPMVLRRKNMAELFFSREGHGFSDLLVPGIRFAMHGSGQYLHVGEWWRKCLRKK